MFDQDRADFFFKEISTVIGLDCCAIGTKESKLYSEQEKSFGGIHLVGAEVYEGFNGVRNDISC
jgi:hypothetical protein